MSELTEEQLDEAARLARAVVGLGDIAEVKFTDEELSKIAKGLKPKRRRFHKWITSLVPLWLVLTTTSAALLLAVSVRFYQGVVMNNEDTVNYASGAKWITNTLFDPIVLGMFGVGALLLTAGVNMEAGKGNNFLSNLSFVMVLISPIIIVTGFAQGHSRWYDHGPITTQVTQAFAGSSCEVVHVEDIDSDYYEGYVEFWGQIDEERSLMRRKFDFVYPNSVKFLEVDKTGFRDDDEAITNTVLPEQILGEYCDQQ